jgi:hypothetical protein
LTRRSTAKASCHAEGQGFEEAERELDPARGPDFSIKRRGMEALAAIDGAVAVIDPGQVSGAA